MNRIALVINDLVRFGGAERYLLQQFKYWLVQGYDCRIFTWNFNPDIYDFQSVKDKVMVCGSDQIRLQDKIKSTVDEIGKWAPELVIAHVQPANVVGYKCLRKFKIPYCLNIHGTFINFPHDILRYSAKFRDKFKEYITRYPELKEFINSETDIPELTLKKKFQIRYWADLDYKAFQNAELIFTLSKRVGDNIKYFYNRDSIIHFPGTSRKEKPVQPNIELDPENLNLLFVGRLDIRKRVDLILESIKELKQESSRTLKLFIVGTGPEKEGLQKKANKLGIEDSIIWPGKVSDGELSWFLDNCDMLLYPAWVTYGLIIPEALASGLPVVISEDTGLAPELENEPGVEIIKPEIGELVDAVKSLKDFNKSNINVRSIENRFSDAGAFSLIERGIKDHLLLRKEGELNIMMLPKFSNPYQDVLIEELRKNGCNLLTDFNSFTREKLKILCDRIDVVHLHWLDPFYLNVENKFQAIRNSKIFLHKIKYLQKHGVKIIKTIHNKVNHKRIFPELDIKVRKKLHKIVDGGIVKSRWAGGVMENEFGPDFSNLKVIYLPNYSGVYPDYISKGDARKQLGLEQDDRVVLFFGWIQPYKNVEKLLDLNIFNEKGQYKILLAGQAVPDTYRKQLLNKIHSHPGVLPYLEYIPDDEIQVYFNAADIFILPYSDFLTSSNLILALTFGLPILCSDHGYFKEILNGSSNRIVDMGDSENFEREIIAFFEDDLERIGVENKKLSEKFSPEKIGRETAEYYRKIINEK